VTYARSKRVLQAIIAAFIIIGATGGFIDLVEAIH
jgi:hypothetical protein